MYCFQLVVCTLAYTPKVDETESIGHIDYVSTAHNFIPLSYLIHIHLLQLPIEKTLIRIISTVKNVSTREYQILMLRQPFSMQCHNSDPPSQPGNKKNKGCKKSAP